MLPRQAILPAVFSKETADSRLLTGSDWTAIFAEGAGNPPSARIAGNRLVAGSITAAQIGAKTITAGQIANATLTSAQIVPGTITRDRLDPRLIIESRIPPGTIQASSH